MRMQNKIFFCTVLGAAACCSLTGSVVVVIVKVAPSRRVYQLVLHDERVLKRAKWLLGLVHRRDVGIEATRAML